MRIGGNAAMKFHYGNTDVTLNLAEVLENSARARPQAIATICLGSQLTYAEINTAANRLANGLRNLGVREGDRVAVMLPNIPEFVIAYFAVLKLGGTVV
ncbi:MAG: AMP-binding protein, partial [Chloroflexi bacterium]|nr:AMP-binding protein [Chloroflexota bacterium]